MKMSIHATWLMLLALPAAWAQNTQPTLSLEKALTRGLDRADLREALAGHEAVAESEILEQRTWDAPEISAHRESLSRNGGDEVESAFAVAQRFKLGGTRRLKVEAAKRKKNAASLQNESRILDFAALIKTQFFEVLHRQQRLVALTDWEEKTAQIAEVIALRENAGEISGYDRRRLTRELAETRALLARERAFHSGERERLAEILSLDRLPQLTGVLLPPEPDGSLKVEGHPELRAFDATAKAASLEEQAANRWRLTEITLEAGVKAVELSGASDQGVVLSARLPLPLWNSKQSQRLKARAECMVARSEKALAQSQAEGEARALRRQIRQLRAAVAQFRQDGVAASHELLRIAQLAYREGEVDLLAVLDACQSLRDARLTALSMAAETRALMIELERLGGVQ